MSSNNVKKTLRHLHDLLQGLPITRKKLLYERLRLKVARDITDIMREKEVPLEILAKVMGLKKVDMRDWIWDRDLKLSELAKLLDKLDSEFYPIIRERNLRREV